MRDMKNKLIILIILLFSVYATAQVKTFDTPVKLNDIAEVTTVDSLLTSSSTGVINKIKYTTIFAKLLADLNAAGIAGSFDPVITNPQTGETLIYDGTNWVNSTIGGGGSETDPIFSAWDKDYADLINTPTTITAQQTADITANNAKVGITTQQAADIAANNAKVTNTDNQNAINVPFAPYLDLTETNTQEVIEQLNDKVDALSVGGSSTNLTYQSSPTNGVIESSTGQNAIIPAGNQTNAGLLLPGHYDKLLNMSITQPVDLDQMEIDVAANNAKVTNTDNQTGEQVFLDNYVKAISSQTISATDNVNTALGKLEYKVDNASGGGIQSVVAGTNVTVDNTDPLNPIVSSTSGGGSYTFNAPLSESGGAVSFDDSNYPTLNSPNSYAVNVSNTFNGKATFNRGTNWSSNYGHDWGGRMRVRWRSATNDMDWSNINGGNATGMRLGVNGLSLSAPDANFDATERLDVNGNIKASGTVELAEPTANSHATTKRYVDEMNQFTSDDFNEIIGGPILNRTISIDDTKWATDAEVASTYNTIANFSALSLRATPYYTSATTNTLTSVSLHSHGGSNYGDNSQNATTYTIDQSTIGTAVTGGFATWVVNTATKPVVKELDGTTDGTEIDSANSLWSANTDVRIYAYYNADGVKYAFVRI